MPDFSAPLETPPASSRFPVLLWGRMEATFLPLSLPFPEGIPVTAGLVFALREGRFLLADIEGRGWCTLGGHIEPGESAEEAVRREAHEEAGATLGALHPIGAYLFRYLDSERQAAVLVFWAEVLEVGEIPEGTESRGTAWMGREELPERYFLWDALIEAVFDHALTCYHSGDIR